VYVYESKGVSFYIEIHTVHYLHLCVFVFLHVRVFLPIFSIHDLDCIGHADVRATVIAHNILLSGWARLANELRPDVPLKSEQLLHNMIALAEDGNANAAPDVTVRVRKWSAWSVSVYICFCQCIIPILHLHHWNLLYVFHIYLPHPHPRTPTLSLCLSLSGDGKSHSTQSSKHGAERNDPTAPTDANTGYEK